MKKGRSLFCGSFGVVSFAAAARSVRCLPMRRGLASGIEIKELTSLQALKDVIAANIVLLRRDANMTQLELAEKLNYSDKAVSKWERGESIPDITVLKQIADLFQVSLDFLVQEEHPVKHEGKQTLRQRIRNHGFITGICVLLVWLIATLVFVILDISMRNPTRHWLSFVYAVPVSMIVWLVFNSIWFKPHRNFLIVSLLMWSILISLYLSFLVFSSNLWQLFVLGIPGQFIILMWSRVRRPGKGGAVPPQPADNAAPENEP